MTYPSLPQRLVGVNLKMYFDVPMTTSYLTSITNFITSSSSSSSSSIGIFILPSYPCLSDANQILHMTPQVILGAQNCHGEDDGAFTGEVSAVMLKQMGCGMVCVGHAERRGMSGGETDEMIGIKAWSVVRNGMIPLICIGEKKKSQNDMMMEGVEVAVRECSDQMKSVLDMIPGESSVIFAYEPVWAIGGTEAADSKYVVAVMKRLRGLMVDRRGEYRMIYGGSAGVGTWGKLKGEVDGLFLGRFAHDVKNLERVVREVEEE